ncbi:MAG: hypothetical protein Q9169_007498 [Polycauliona sp. 2 TL-2023]
MPAPVQDADVSDASTPPHRKSNAWPNEERDDIYNRRQQGEKWDTICEKTPTKSRGRRKGQPSANNSPAVVNGKKASKARSSPEDADQSDADSDEQSTASAPTKPMGGLDGAPPTDNDSESVKEPDSARKQRLRRRQKQTSDNDEDEDEPPVSTRPRRSRASGVNYNVLQNSGFGLDDQADDATAESTPSNKPARLSKIVALKMGSRKEPVVDSARKPSKSRNIDAEDEPTPSHEEDNFTRRSQRVKKVSTLKTGNPASPSPRAADDESLLPGGKRRRRSHFPQDVEPEGSIDDDSDLRTTRSSRKRKPSEAELKRASVDSAPGSGVEQPSVKKRRQSKPNEHLGFLPNGQPRRRRRRRTRAEMEADERRNSTPTTTTKVASTATKAASTATTAYTRRHSQYKFPFLEGYEGPKPPDLKQIIARQEENERQNPGRESESDAESTSSSLQSLNDDDEDEDVNMDDTIDIQPQTANAIPIDEEVSPMTRPNMDEQLSAAVSAQPNMERQPSTTVAGQSSPVKASSVAIESTLDIPDAILYPEDIERARENARKLQALVTEQKTVSKNQLTAAETNLEKERLRTQDLARELEDLRKTHGECESKATNAKAIAQQVEGLSEIQKLYDEGLKKLTASETAVAEEKKRSAQLEETCTNIRTQFDLREDNIQRHFAELADERRDLEKELRDAKDDNSDYELDVERLKKTLGTVRTRNTEIQTLNDDFVLKNGTLRKRVNEVELENADLTRKLSNANSKLADFTRDYSRPLKEHTPQSAHSIGQKIHKAVTGTTLTDGASSPITSTTTQTTTLNTKPTLSSPTKPSPTALSLPSPSAIFDMLRPSPSPATIPIATLKPHLESIRKTHIQIGFHLRASTESHGSHDTALNGLREKLDDGDISMNKVRERVRELVVGSEKVGKGLKSAVEGSEGAKGKVMGLWDVVEPPPPGG